MSNEVDTHNFLTDSMENYEQKKPVILNNLMKYSCNIYLNKIIFMPLASIVFKIMSVLY